MAESAHNPTLFRCGDVVGEYGPSWLGRAIAWATRGRYEARTWCSHVGRMVSPTEIAETGARFRIVPFDVTRKVRVWRFRTGLSHEALACMTAKAQQYLGAHYGWWKLLPHLADGLLEKLLPVRSVYLFRRLMCLKRYPICSWEVAWTYEECVGYRFGVSPRAATPDDIVDWIEAHPDDWECVYDNVEEAA